jgi:hypothetical protein
MNHRWCSQFAQTQSSTVAMQQLLAYKLGAVQLSCASDLGSGCAGGWIEAL